MRVVGGTLLRHHDQVTMSRSNLVAQLGVVEIEGGVPAKAITDGAYKRGTHVSPKSKQNRLNAMTGQARAVAKAIDKGNSAFRDSSETSFRKVSEMWGLNRDYTKLRPFQGGKNRVGEILMVFYLQVFVTNLHTCLYDSQTGLVADIPPPSIEEYLHSTNCGLVVDGRK
jgi:hypothetical protein